MKISNLKKKLITGLATFSLIGAITFYSKNSLTYETGNIGSQSIHPLLVEKISENYSFPNGKNFDLYNVKVGSINEDSPNNNYARAGNHFQHWQTGDALNCPLDYCNAIKPNGSSAFLPLGNWIKNSSAQSTYPYGDHSWDRVNEDYRNGFIGENFGHSFHLLSDLTVPNHVKNYPHPFSWDNIYEVWTDANKLNLMNNIQVGTIPNYNSLDELISSAARFTGENFYSDDHYDNSVQGTYLIFNGEKTYIGKNIEGKEIKLLRKNLLVNFLDDGCMFDQANILLSNSIKNGIAALKILNSNNPSGNGSYCTHCISVSDCQTGWDCGGWEGTNATFCYPNFTCSSDNNCGGGYTCHPNAQVCTPSQNLQCHNNDSYVYDSCGNNLGIYQDCNSNQTCQNGQCIDNGVTCNNECANSGQTYCSGNSVKQCGNYDYDSCLEEIIVQNCNSNQNCEGNQCVNISTDNCWEDLGNGTIRNNSTGRTWQKSSSSQIVSLESAINYCNNLSLGGYSWKLPTKEEITELCSLTATNGCYYNCSLIGLCNDGYWTSTIQEDISSLEDKSVCIRYDTYSCNNGATELVDLNSGDGYVRCLKN